MEQILLQSKQMWRMGQGGSWEVKVPLGFLPPNILSSSLIQQAPPTPQRPSACVYTPSKHRPPHTHLASPVNRALRGIAETHVFIPSHFVQILQDLEEKRKHGRHPMREDP